MTKRNEKQYILRQEIEIFDFASGIMAKINNGPKNTRTIHTILPVNIYVSTSVPKSATVTSRLFECCEFLTIINGSYDSGDLDVLKSPDGFEKPTKLNFEIWESIDSEYEWQHTGFLIIDDIKITKAYHTGDGNDRCCAGEVKLEYKNLTTKNIENGKVVKIGPQEKYPSYCLKDALLGKLNDNT